MCAKKFLTMLFGNTNFGPKVANFLCLYGTKSTIDFAGIDDRGIRDMMEKVNIFRQDSTSFDL